MEMYRPFRSLRVGFSLALLALALGLVASPLLAQDNSSSSSPYLFGDWGGARTTLAEEKGVKFDFFYISDSLTNPEGGVERETGWSRVRGTMDIDFGKLANVHGLSLHVTGLWQSGVNLGGSYLGSIANPSGLVSAHTTRLDSFWLQQDLFHNKLSVRVGQFAGMDFYGVQYYGGNYLMEPLDYAFGNLFNTYESFDPAAGPAVEIKVAPIKRIYYRAAAMSGNRNPYGEDTTGFNFVKKESAVFLNEVGFLTGLPDAKNPSKKLYPGLYKLGGVYNGGQFVDPFTNAATTGNYLIYVMANQAIFRPTASLTKGLDVHFGFDHSPNDAYNKVSQQYTGGLIYTGLIPQRDNDAIAFGFVYSKISDLYSTEFYNAGLLNPSLGSEKAFEVNYMAKITPWLTFQPVVQVYSDLGANPKNGTGVVAGFRTKVSF